MAKISFQQLEQNLKQAKLKNVFALVGTEVQIARQVLSRLEACFKIDKSSLERSVFTGKELKSEQVLNALQTVPLLGGSPFVIVREADKLSKENMNMLADYIARNNASASLVFLAKKLDGRSKLMSQINKHGLIVECKPLYANQVPSWIGSEVKRYGKQISHDAAGYMADLVGTDLGQIAQVIERLVLFVGKRSLIELSDVETSVAETTQRTIFELTDALGERNVHRAVQMLANVIDHGQAPVMILAMIARHFRILLKAKEVAGRISNPAEIARYLGVHPFFAKQYADQANNFSLNELKDNFAKLSECDRELKSSRLSRLRILEHLVMEVLHKKKAA